MAFMNYDNNKYEIRKWSPDSKVEKWMYYYQSTTWVSVRGAWFFDFFGEICKLIYEERDWSLKKVATTAY